MASSTGGVTQENVVYVTKEVVVEKPVITQVEKKENVVEETTVSLRPTAPVVETKEEVKEEKKEEPVVNTVSSANEEKFLPTEDDLLNVLVQATKDDLNMAKQKWVILPKYLNSPSTAKATVLLMDGLPVAAAKNMIVLAYDNDTYLNRVNSVSNHEMMNNFLKAIYNDNMMCYCVTKEEFMRLKDTYMSLRALGKLPAPVKINFGEENKKDEGLEFGKKIFGDFLTVKEE